MKLKGFQKLTPTDEALAMWFDALQLCKPKTKSVSLADALGRVLAEDFVAVESLPRFDKSAMDGYAVKAVNVSCATQFKPVTLELTEDKEVEAGEAKQIWTGNPIPKGADAVVMLEDTEKKEDQLQVYEQAAVGENVSKVGEDIKAGTLIAKAGTRLNPYHLGLAAAQGILKLKVAVKPKIAILATGNELAELGAKRGETQIYDSNKTMFSAICRELGAEATELPIIKDNFDEIANKIQTALKTHDVILTTGGTSVGGLDLVPDAVNKIGKPGIIVHGVLLRPGMPAAVAVLEGKPILVLSGNPVAAVVAFEVFGRPLISRMLGMTKTEARPILKATLSRQVKAVLGRKTYVRVCVTLKGGELIAEPISAKGSGAISTMTQSNGFVVVPEDREGLPEGETVFVHMFAPVEES